MHGLLLCFDCHDSGLHMQQFLPVVLIAMLLVAPLQGHDGGEGGHNYDEFGKLFVTILMQCIHPISLF